ncbi:MAG TPA: FAD-dependent oxidoreductase [Thermoanaerobaculia bacterium]|nr:FAD-dependent oxidoreductase [Thermoanaerobaculia bacterium]
MSKNVVVIGGGLAGLAAALYLARAGRRVTIFEKRRTLGGRAITHLRHGYRFNLGAHAIYRSGPGAAVYRELGVPLRGGRVKSKGVAVLGGETYTLPFTPAGFITSSLLTVKAKAELAALLLRVWRLDPSRYATMTAREWLDANVSNERLRQVMEALMRLATYADHAETESAAAALAQLKISLRGVLYVDEGWQKIVDTMHSAAVAAGVNFVTSSRIVGVHHDGAVQSIELGGLEVDADRMDTQSIALPELKPEDVSGPRLPADTVVLAVDPNTAAELVGDAKVTNGWTSARKITAACLDVALSKLPEPRKTFALGIDQPLYLSVHSQWAQLTPRGGALIHVAKYRKSSVAGHSDEVEESRVRRSAESARDESEMEALLDTIQPGWRNVLVHRRFLPSMTVSNALITPTTQRPSPITPVRGLYIAGDWVGNEGMLSDAALTSARAAAKAILASA